MLIQVSDLHLEFNPEFRIRNTENVPWLNLGGDICVAEYFTRGPNSPKREHTKQWLEFFEIVSKEFEYVTYILGNHEHYHGIFTETANILREALAHLPNIHILDNDWIKLPNGYNVFGATLWTNIDKGNPVIADYIRRGMNDFKLIQCSTTNYRKFMPFDSKREHEISLIKFDKGYTDNCIFLSHHAPSYQSIHEEYRSGRYSHLNPAYYSDLEQFILDRPDIKLWTHGHVHSNFDYYVGNTRVVCNPHGYGNENKQGYTRLGPGFSSGVIHLD